MKKLITILLAVLALTGCGQKTSLKVDDPAARAAMRTRDASCPIDEVLSAKGMKATLNIFGEIKPKALLTDYRQALSVSEETKSMARAKDAFEAVRKDHAGEYNPGLTLYSTIMFLAFVVIVLFKTFRAIFKNS